MIQSNAAILSNASRSTIVDSKLISSLSQVHDAIRFNTVKFTVRELKGLAENLGCRTQSEKRDVLVKIITLRLANLLPK
jgi:hypothetical protein